jgi:hypothetical protein
MFLLTVGTEAILLRPVALDCATEMDLNRQEYDYNSYSNRESKSCVFCKTLSSESGPKVYNAASSALQICVTVCRYMKTKLLEAMHLGRRKNEVDLIFQVEYFVGTMRKENRISPL